MANDFKSVFTELISKTGGAASSGSSGTAPNIKEFSELTKQFNATLSSINSRDITSIGTNTVKLVNQLNKTITTAAGALVSMVDNALAIAFNLQTQLLNKTTKGVSGGMAGAVEGFGSTLKESFNKIAQVTGLKSVGAAGDMMGQVMSTAMSIFTLRFQDALVVSKARYAATAQAGGEDLSTRSAKGAQAAATMRGLYKDFSREEAEGWGKAIQSQGAVLEPKLSEMMVRVGMSMGLDSSAMAPILDQFMILESDSQKAGKALETSFRAAQAAAVGTNIPVAKLQKGIQEAAVSARFLNVDYQTVASTMQMLTKNQEKFKAAGVSVREDGGKILKELTGGTKEWGDALHVFFGTKGGTEGSPMAGWVKSKFGAEQAGSLQRSGEGGFTMEGGNSGQMMVQRLDVMKSTMMEASKNAGDDNEALYMQMKIAQETFGMSEETAKVLALKGKDDLKSLAENPKMADEFKSQQEIMKDLKSMASIDQNIQRSMATLAASQIKYMMATATNTALLAAMEAGLIKKDSGEAKKATAESFSMLMDANEASLIAMKKTAGQTLNAVAPGELDKMEASFRTIKTAAGMASGGSVSANSIYRIQDAGANPEIFSSGSNKYLIPGVDGEIFNPSKTNDYISKGLSNSGAYNNSQSQPNVNISIGGISGINSESFEKALKSFVISQIKS